MNVSIDAVEKRYGKVAALDGLSLEIPAGSTFGLLGTNGAGKTTLFRLIVGHDTPDSGRIAIGGRDIRTAGDRVRRHIGYLPDRLGFPGRLTGREVLEFYTRIHGVHGSVRDESIDEVLELVDLTHVDRRRVSSYSNGMGRRLGLAAVLIGGPSVLVLDEPTAGLDPRGVASFHDIVDRVNEDTGATIVMASHALAEVERCCDRIAIIDDGRLCLTGTVNALREAVATSVTLRVTVDEPSPTIWRERLRSMANCTVSVDGSDLVVTCPRESVVAIVTRLNRDEVEGIAIDEPGLDTVFHRAIDEGVRT